MNVPSIMSVLSSLLGSDPSVMTLSKVLQYYMHVYSEACIVLSHSKKKKKK